MGTEKKMKWLHLRLTVSEQDMLKKQLANSTCRNISQYARDVIFDRPIIATYRNLSIDEVLWQMATLTTELNAIGNNLNQITKKLHTIRLMEQHAWGSQFLSQSETVVSKIDELKALMSEITERWLR